MLNHNSDGTADGRSVVIELTGPGEAAISKLCVHVASEQNKKLAWLSAEQRETALAGIRLFLQSLG